MDDFPPEYYFTAPIQEKVSIVEISMENKEILFAFDRYMPEITGIYTSFQYKGMKADLYDFPIMR